MLLRSKWDTLIALFVYSKILSRLVKQESANPLWNLSYFMAFSFCTLDNSTSLTSQPTVHSEQMASVTQMMHSRAREKGTNFTFGNLELLEMSFHNLKMFKFAFWWRGFLKKIKAKPSRETKWEIALENTSFPIHLPSKELHNWGNNNGTYKATNGKNRNSYGPEESQCAFIHREAISSFPSFIVKLLDILKENI